jgi:PAS domain S-box-containing protein
MKTNRSHASGQLRLVLETALDAVIVMNSDGTVADWNERAAEVFGWSREQAVGRIMAELIIPPQLREAHHLGLRKFLDTGEGPLIGKRIEVTGIRKSGEEFPVELSIAPVHDQLAVIFVGCLRDISERKRAEEHQQLLLAELDHRVKNMLTVVAGIASMTERSSKTLPEFSEKFGARIQALSRAYTMLTARRWGTTLLNDLIAEILAPYGPVDSAQFAVEGPPVALKPNTILTLNLVLHELVTNASKYGAFSVPEGNILIEWNIDAGSPPQLHLTWHETGVPNVSPPVRSGFGTKLIEMSMQHDLGGRVVAKYEADGVRYDFHFPLRG